MFAAGPWGLNLDPVKTAIFVGGIFAFVILATYIGYHWPWNGKTRKGAEEPPPEPAFHRPERPEFQRPTDEGDLL